ncbi:MAG: phosphotransferase family protein [Gemmataceae bacterium]
MTLDFQRLTEFLHQQGVTAQIRTARQLTGGASRDTWAIDADFEGRPVGLVLRRDLGGQIVEHALDRAAEYLVMQRAAAGNIPVPRPGWLCLDPSVAGAPFILMERLEGESIGRRIVRDPALAEARKVLPAQMAMLLARIHRLDYQDLNFLPQPAPGQSPAQQALERAERQLRALGEPHPALELALRWLTPRVPQCPQPVLVHGDFRLGNIMVGPHGLIGIFDWEFAHIGDPAEDLAWPCVRSWRFGQDHLRFAGLAQPDEFLAAYRYSGGENVDPDRLLFWEILGNLTWAVGCIQQAHRHLSGQAPSLEFASLGRRTAEMELELLDLIARVEKSS